MKTNKKSAGILLYKLDKGYFEVLLVHPGGPFFAKKDWGAWSIPKGEFGDGETPLEVAKREFHEEIGREIQGDFIELSPIKQKSGKTVYAWAVEGDIDTKLIKSNTFSLEWPIKSGKIQEFPEIDKGEWFTFSMGKKKINESQAALIEELVTKLNLTSDQIEKPEIKKKPFDSSSQLELF